MKTTTDTDPDAPPPPAVKDAAEQKEKDKLEMDQLGEQSVNEIYNNALNKTGRIMSKSDIRSTLLKRKQAHSVLSHFQPTTSEKNIQNMRDLIEAKQAMDLGERIVRQAKWQAHQARKTPVPCHSTYNLTEYMSQTTQQVPEGSLNPYTEDYGLLGRDPVQWLKMTPVATNVA